MLQHWFYKNYGEWRDCFEIMVAIFKDEQIYLLFFLLLFPEERAKQSKSSKESKIFKITET